MDKVKFKIKRSFWAGVCYFIMNECIPIYFLVFFAGETKETKDYFTFCLGVICLLPAFIFLWRWRTVTIKGNRMIIHFGIIYFYINIDISTVTKVHYKEKKEEIYGGLWSVNIPFEKPENTVCFTSKRGDPFYIATTEPEKFYALLKAREVPE